VEQVDRSGQVCVEVALLVGRLFEKRQKLQGFVIVLLLDQTEELA
jgi:hypothetical protein